jgi:protein-disulfide isomerase
MIWKRTALTIGASAIGLVVLAFYWRVAFKPVDTGAVASTAAPVAIQEPFVTFVDPSRGPVDAKLTIVEFGDHACPYCKSTQEDIDLLLSEHPADVRFVWKSAPSPLHPGAETAAQAALCAGRQGKFWEFHEGLFANPGFLDESSMVILATELDLDITKFGECLSTDETLPLVERTVTEARALGLTTIPTIYVNGARYEGALTYDQLLEATDL